MVDAKTKEVKFVCIGAHLRSLTGDGGFRRRVAEVKSLVTLCSSETRVVVIGDLNSDDSTDCKRPGSNECNESLAGLVKAGLTRVQSKETTWTDPKGMKTDSRLDHAYVKGLAATLHVSAWHKQVSDHRALLLEVSGAPEAVTSRLRVPYGPAGR